MSLRIYEIPSGFAPVPKSVHPMRVIARAHDAPVHVCRADPTSTYVASGAADGIVKVWDILRGHATHVLRGHGGIVSALAFSYPRHNLGLEERVMRLVTASVDTRLRVWDLGHSATEARSGKQMRPESVLEGHVSVPRSIDITEDGRWMVSGGRDSVALVWDMSGLAEGKKGGRGKEKDRGPILARTVTVLERVEAVGLLNEEENVVGSSSSPGQFRFFTAGEKGVVKVWDAREGIVLCTFGQEHAVISGDQEGQQQILNAMSVFVPFVSHTHSCIMQICPCSVNYHICPCRSKCPLPLPPVRHTFATTDRFQR